MSRRSPPKRKATTKLGAKAPSLRARLETVEKHLREQEVYPSSAMLRAQSIQNLETLCASPSSGALGRTTSPPPIKPRLEDLLTRLYNLNNALDHLSHQISGDGGAPVASGASSPSPFSIPDQLAALEDLMQRATSKLDSITGRF